MKQKLVIMLLATCMALSCTLAFTACDLFGGDPGDSGGNGGDTTIDTPGDPDDEPVTPPVEDEPVTPPVENEPVTPPVENEPVTPHEHTYTSAVTGEPTCTQEGVMTYTCTCGDSYTEAIPTIAHTYVDGVCSSCGEHEPTEGLVFKLSDDGTQYSMTRYTGTATEVYIPAVHEGLPVTSIGYRAFDGCSSLTSITIPDSVTSIGERAFQHCSSLTSITIPDSVTSIEILAFYDCSGLSAVYITSMAAWCNIEFDGEYAKRLLSHITSISMESLLQILLFPTASQALGVMRSLAAKVLQVSRSQKALQASVHMRSIIQDI